MLSRHIEGLEISQGQGVGERVRLFPWERRFLRGAFEQDVSAVRIIVDLPPGSGKGPVVSPNLNRYGVQSAPLYRGLLNLAYLWFDPGRTRFPVRGGKHWLQVEDPKRYPTITDDLLIELFYPTSTQKARRILASRARKDLGRLVKDAEARILEGRLLPPPPRECR